MSSFEMTTVDDGSGGFGHFVQTDHVNWVLLQDESGVTLIDGGYPKQADAVADSLAQIGADWAEVRGALVTHAHVDHIGGLRILAQRHGFPVFTDPREVPHIHREYLQQATPAGIAAIAWRPRVLRWLVEVSRLGVLDRNGIPEAEAFPTTGPLDLPGRPEPVACHGHTDGHSTYLVAGGRVLVSGDALITGHATTATTGPQCIGSTFHHDPEANRASLRALAAREDASDEPVEWIFPGHGPAHPGPVATAVATALAR